MQNFRKNKQRQARLRREKHRRHYGPKTEEQRAAPVQMSPLVNRARSAESYLGASLDHCQRTIRAGEITHEVGEILKITARMSERAAEFNLWLEDDPAAEWFKGEADY
jgi:hypothetical protein